MSTIIDLQLDSLFLKVFPTDTFIDYLKSKVFESEVPVRILFSPVDKTTQCIHFAIIKEPTLERTAKDMQKAHFFSRISSKSCQVFDSFRNHRLVIPAIPCLDKNYTSIYYFLKEASHQEISNYFQSIVQEMYKLLDIYSQIVLNFHGADEPIVHARIVEYKYDVSIWLEQMNLFEKLPYLDCNLVEFLQEMWKTTGNKTDFYQKISNTYKFFCTEFANQDDSTLFMIRHEGKNLLIGNWTNHARSTIIHAEWKASKFIIVRTLLERGLPVQFTDKEIFQGEGHNYPIICILRRKKIPFVGSISMKVDGQLTGVCVYKPDTMEFKIVNQWIDCLPINSLYRILRDISIKNHNHLIIFNSQRTFIIGLDNYISSINEERLSWMVGAIIFGGLKIPFEKNNMKTLVETYISFFFKRICQQIENVEFDWITLSFESVCPHRQCMYGRLHRDLTVDYKEYRLVFLGMTTSLENKIQFIPHYECKHKYIFEHPMTWINSKMTGESVQYILEQFNKHNLDNFSQFVKNTKPQIVNPNMDVEGFIVRIHEMFVKIKTESFVEAFTQFGKINSQEKKLFYPYFRKLDLYDKLYLQIINEISNQLNGVEPSFYWQVFDNAFKAHGLELQWCSPLNKRYSMGIFNFTIPQDLESKRELEIKMLKDPEYKNLLVTQFFLQLGQKIVMNPENWREIFFKCCELSR